MLRLKLKIVDATLCLSKRILRYYCFKNSNRNNWQACSLLEVIAFTLCRVGACCTPINDVIGRSLFAWRLFTVTFIEGLWFVNTMEYVRTIMFSCINFTLVLNWLYTIFIFGYLKLHRSETVYSYQVIVDFNNVYYLL